MLNTKIGAKVAVVSFIKSSIPIAAGADFYAYIAIQYNDYLNAIQLIVILVLAIALLLVSTAFARHSLSL